MNDSYELYEELAKRNNWSFSINSDDNRPYFMKDGKYAIPDEYTSDEDKQLLAAIIAEGSEELAKLIITCWNNNLIVAGPCSGIIEFHDKEPFALHFGVSGKKEIITALYDELMIFLPDLAHRIRDVEDGTRYDLNYFLKGKEISKEEANQIFKAINISLEKILEISEKEKTI